MGLKSENKESIDSYDQHLKCSLGTIGAGTITKDILIKGFTMEGTRTLVISVFWCLKCDEKYLDRFFKHQEVLQIPFINPFKAFFDIKQIPKSVFQSLDVVGPFKPSVLRFEKQQSWLISSKFQNTSSSPLIINVIDLLKKVAYS